MRIGELAARAGVNPKTIRYYEEIRVLPEPERTPAGYRVFSEEDAERLRFVRTAQRLGFRLDEIRQILALRDRERAPCDYVGEALSRKVDELDARVEQMRHLREQLVRLVRGARSGPSARLEGLVPSGGTNPSNVRGSPESAAYCCPVIEDERPEWQ